MSNSKIIKLVLGMSTALALVSTQAHAATTIKLGVATEFGNAANDLASAFQSYYAQFGSAYAYNVVVTVSSAKGIKNDIVAGSPTAPAFDLFLSSDKKEVNDLVNNYPSLISGSPFKYAKDYLLLYSLTTDISAGLPYPFTTNFVIPDPSQSNYGSGAAQILSSAPWYVDPSTIPSGYVFTSSTPGTTLATINAGTYAYGFIAKSSVCRLNAAGTEVYPPNSYYHFYDSGDAAHKYDPLPYEGITVASTVRTTAQATEISDFIAFATGTTDSRGATTTIGMDTIQGYCYKTPE